MKNFKKLLVITFAVVALVVGTVLAVTAADVRPVGTVAEAELKLQAVADATNLSEKARAMRDLDTYVEEHRFEEIEYNQFQISHRLAQEDLRRESATLTAGYLDTVLDMDSDMQTAETNLEGVKKLLGKSSARGYYDTASEAYDLLQRRMKLGGAVLSLRRVMSGQTLLERGTNLKSLAGEVEARTLDENLPEYENFISKYNEAKAQTSAELMTTAETLAAKLIGFDTPANEVKEASELLKKMLSFCYFDPSLPQTKALTDKKAIGDLYLAYRDVRDAQTDVDKAGKMASFNVVMEASGVDLSNDYYAGLNAIVNEERVRLTGVIDGMLDEILAPVPTYTKANLVEDALTEAKDILASCYTASAEAYNTQITTCSAYLYIIELDGMPEGEEKAIRTKKIVSEVNALRLNVNEGLGKDFKEAFDLRTAAVLEWVYATLDAVAATATDANATFDAVVRAEALLEKGLNEYYIIVTDAKYKEYSQARLDAVELIKRNTVGLLQSSLAEAREIADLDEKYTALEKIRADVKTYKADLTSPEVIEVIRDVTYEQLGILVAKVGTVMEGTDFNAQVDAIAAVNALEKQNEGYINAEDDAYVEIMTSLATYTASFTASALAQCRPLLDASKAATGFEKVAKFMEVEAFISLYGLTGATEEGKAFMAEVEEERAKANKVLYAERDKNASGIPLAEYSDTNINGPFDFESVASPSLPFTSNAPKCTTVSTDFMHGANGSKGSLKVTTSPGGKDSYFTIGLYGLNQGSTVFEFDITSFQAKNFRIYLESKAENADGSGTQWLGFCRLDGGNLTWYTGGGTIASDILVPGAWTHISFVFNINTYDLEAYVNYQYKGKMNFLERGAKPFKLPNIRLGTTLAIDHSFNIDNVVSYYGTKPRDLEKFKNITDEEYFLMSWRNVKDFIADPTSVSSADVSTSFEKASSLVIKLWDSSKEGDERYIGNPEYMDVEALKSAIIEFLEFDTNTLNNAMKTVIYAQAGEKVAEIQAMGRATDILMQRELAVTALEDFLAASSAYVSAEEEEYQQIAASIARFRSEIEYDKHLNELAGMIEKLKSATNLNAKRAYIAMIEEDFDMEAVAEQVPELFEEYITVKNSIQLDIAKEDTNIFIGCMNKFAKYETADEALKDYAELTKFMELAREAYNRGNIQEFAKGYNEALKKYNLLQELFYQRKQQEHVKTLNKMVEQYANSVSFIEKEGITIYMREYFETEDLDMTNEAIKSLYSTLLIYEDSESSLREAYETLLIENTSLFVATVRRMKITDEYLALRALFNEATDAYYYMNVNEPEVVSATADYLEYVRYFEALDARCEDFIRKVALIRNADTQKKYYAALVEAYRVKQEGITDKYTGVSGALNEYEKALNAYVVKTETNNSAFTGAVRNVYAVRVPHLGAKMAVAAFKKYFD